MTKFYKGKVCAKHPTLKGKRYISNKHCTLCKQEKAEQWVQSNPERVKATYIARGAKYYCDAARKSKYGLTAAQFTQLLAKQSGLCAICGKPPTEHRLGVKKAMNIDHCHTTGKLRGLLCSHCNKAIGFFNDDVALLKSAIKYLRSYK